MRQLNPRQALANPEIQMVESTSPNPHQDLIFSGTHIGNVLKLENLRPAEFVESNRFHKAISPRRHGGTEKGKEESQHLANDASCHDSHMEIQEQSNAFSAQL